MTATLTISAAMSLGEYMVLISAPFNRRGQIVPPVGMNPQCPDWYEDFRRVGRLLAAREGVENLPDAVAAEAGADSVAGQIAEFLCRMERDFSPAAILAYQTMDGGRDATV